MCLLPSFEAGALDLYKACYCNVSLVDGRINIWSVGDDIGVRKAKTDIHASTYD